MSEFSKMLESSNKKLKGTGNNIEYSDTKIFERFVYQLLEYNHGKNTPQMSDENLKLYLEYKSQKLDSLNVRILEDLSAVIGSEMNCITTNHTKITSKHLFRTFKRHFIIKKNKLKFEKKENIVLHENIITANQGKINDNDRFCCPSCGKINTLKQLENSCTECGKNFFITDILPKVSGCFYNKCYTITLPDIAKKVILWGLVGMSIGIPLGIIRMITEMSSYISPKNILQTISNAFITPIECLVSGCIFGVLTILGKLILDNVKLSPVFDKINESKKVLGTFMANYDKNFSYEYFENKVLFYLMLMVYTDDREKFTMFQLEKNVPGFDIVDMTYSGIMEIKSISADDKMCKLRLEITMSDIHDNVRKFIRCDDKFSITMKKNLVNPTDIYFNINKVKCPSCGEYFNALYHNKCEHCKAEYSLINDDWIVTDLRLM